MIDSNIGMTSTSCRRLVSEIDIVAAFSAFAEIAVLFK